MLEFETEESSGQLVAYSESTPFKSYWIEEGAWTYLQVVQADSAGPNLSEPETFYSVEDAMKRAGVLENENETATHH